MFWRFGFSSTSTLDTLLDRPNVSLEEILDEDELLQECKTQNAKLVNYLQQPRVLKRLFQHVVGNAEVGGPGGREWEEKVRFKYPYVCSEVLSSDIWSVVETALGHSEELLQPFWQAILSRDPTGNPPTITQHQHPLFTADAQPVKPGQPGSSDTTSAMHDPNSPNAESSSTGVLGLEVKGSEHGSTITSARDSGPGKSVLAGYWAKVNGVFLDKKPREMIDFIKGIPRIVELFVAHMETPAVVDLLYRIIQCEEVVPNIGVIDWLASEELMPRLIDLLSPSHSADMHNTVSELLKAIIALSAPSPASLTQNGTTEAFGFGNSEQMGNSTNGAVGGVNNRLVRELASETVVQKMVGFMLDASLPSRLSGRLSEAVAESENAESKPNAPALKLTQSAVDDEDEEESDFDAALTRRTPLNPRDTPASEQTKNSYLSSGMFDHHRDSTTTVRPSDEFIGPILAPQIAISSESCTSTLVTCIGVLIELIRKNNSDYFEQHLFHTLRTHLLQRQQEIAERKANKTATSVEGKEDDSLDDSEAAQQPAEQKSQADEEEADDEMEGMEEAMAELSDKLGIVHLGPMLTVLCERLPDFQLLIARPRVEEAKTVNSLGKAPALTFERYRITELYAELLHCSNMALLNRAPAEGPQYSEEGVLLGGIEGLQILARTLQGTDAASESGQDHGQEQATAEKEKETAGDEAGEEEEASQAAAKSSDTQGKPPKGSGHVRQTSIIGGGGGGANGSEDTDDEALLSEVSASGQVGDVDAQATNTNVAEDSSVTSKAVEEADGPDAEIKSVLSHMSLADLTAPSPAASRNPSRVPSPTDDQREYVVGDLLKKKFLECNVIPTILDLFFEYPWNNFLHNVVYDILQQFFNGRMDVGLNRQLTLAVFNQGKMTEKIVEGHRRNEESLKTPRRIRMGYMGHMHLIAEETVKVVDRYPEEIARFVQPSLTDEWQHFVDETLKENREKESAPLAGGRPQMLQSLAFPQHGGADGDLGGGGGLHQVGSDAFASYLSSQMGGGASASDDDDDSDEDTNWLSHDLRHRGGDIESGDGFDDAFAPSSNAFGTSRRGHDLDDSKDDEDDDDWGPFADSSSSSHAVTGNSLSSSAQAYLTPADLAADFQRQQSAADANRFDDAADDASSTMSPFEDGEGGDDDDGESSRARSDSGSSENASGTPFVDLLDNASVRAADVVAAAHARRPSLGQLEGVPANLTPRISRPRTLSNGDSAAADAITAEQPLGPGISPDAQADHQSGMIERVIDGETVKVPLDDLALMAAQMGPPPTIARESALEVDEETEQ